MPSNPPARTLPVIEAAPPSPPADRATDRGRDRRLTAAGLAAAVAFLGAGVVSLALPPEARLKAWLPLHLALAGGAGTAIAAMVPFFMAALTVAPPAPPRLRAIAIAAVAVGASLAAVGRAIPGPNLLAATGAATYVVGILAVLAAALLVVRRATGPRRPATELAYLVALVDVVIGVSLAALFLAGDPAAVADWAALKPAHAWLNLFGFVTLVIAGSLAHFAPTVAGSRITRRPWATAAVALLAVAAPTVAVGYGLGVAALVQLGAGIEAAGAAALVVHGWQAHRDRHAWTTDHAWHAFTSRSLLLAPAWLLVAALMAAARTAVAGADPVGWRLDDLLVPLVCGFVVQALLGALSHLVPAIGPGSPERHAAERRILGRDGRIRLASWNVGVAAASGGVLAGQDLLVAAGAAMLIADLAATLLLLAACLGGRGQRSARAS